MKTKSVSYLKNISSFVIKITIINFILIAKIYGKNFILLSHESVTPKNFRTVLLKHQNYIPYSLLIEAERGIIKKETITDIHWLLANGINENTGVLSENISFNKVINELTNGFLSPLRKNLLLKLLDSSSATPERSQEKEYYPSLQALIIKEGAIRHPGPLESPFFREREDDKLYINGFLIPPEKWSQIKFFPHIYYHIGYISNTYQPIFQWVLGEKISSQSLPKIPLIQGNCLNAKLEQFDLAPEVNSFLGVFPEGCINTLKEADSFNSLELKSMNNLNGASFSELPSDFSKDTWSSKDLWKWGSGLLLLGIIVYETRKNYEIRFSF